MVHNHILLLWLWVEFEERLLLELELKIRVNQKQIKEILPHVIHSPQVLLHPSKQHRPKSGQSPSGCPGDQQEDTDPSQSEEGRGERAGQESPPDTPPEVANSPSFLL